MAETPEIRARIKNLASEVNPYSKGKSYTGINFSFQSILSSSKIYLIVPGLVLLLLVFSRPSFLYKANPPNSPIKAPKKFCFKKLLMFWLVISGSIDIAIFIYNYKQAHA